MLLVLAFQTREPSPPPSFSLATPTPPTQTGPGEKALADLIRALRLPHSHAQNDTSKATTRDPSIMNRAPSFLSGGLPRDRRGRIAHKRNLGGISVRAMGGAGDAEDEGRRWDDDETPRNGFISRTTLDTERERELEILEGLRSPDPIIHTPGVGARASVGGWGLGVAGAAEDVGKATIEEDEYDGDDDEPLTWDEAQLMVENIMVYAGKMTRLQEDSAGANAIRDVHGRLLDAYERKGFPKDAEKQTKKTDTSSASSAKPGVRK